MLAFSGEEQCQPQGNTGPGLEFENSEAPAFAEYPPSATIVGGGPAGALAVSSLSQQYLFGSAPFSNDLILSPIDDTF